MQDISVKQVEEQDAGVKQVQVQVQDLAVERVIPPIRFRRGIRTGRGNSIGDMASGCQQELTFV